LTEIFSLKNCWKRKKFVEFDEYQPWNNISGFGYLNSSNFKIYYLLASDVQRNSLHWLCRDISSIFKFNLDAVFLGEILVSISSKNTAYQATDYMLVDQQKLPATRLLIGH
jgi:hypothetical protein